MGRPSDSHGHRCVDVRRLAEPYRLILWKAGRRSGGDSGLARVLRRSAVRAQSHMTDVRAAIEAGESVRIQCKHGRHRSAAVAVLIKRSYPTRSSIRDRISPQKERRRKITSRRDPISTWGAKEQELDLDETVQEDEPHRGLPTTATGQATVDEAPLKETSRRIRKRSTGDLRVPAKQKELSKLLGETTASTARTPSSYVTPRTPRRLRADATNGEWTLPCATPSIASAQCSRDDSDAAPYSRRLPSSTTTLRRGAVWRQLSDCANPTVASPCCRSLGTLLQRPVSVPCRPAF